MCVVFFILFQVKPVRDTVCEALQLWKAIYDPNAPQSWCQFSFCCFAVLFVR
jgi:hypothetical protein